MKKYSKTHEWYEDQGNGEVTVGVSQHAAHELSDIVFVELPDVGKDVPAGGSVCVLESVKAVSDVYIPVAGQVTSVNEGLRDKPSLVNEDPEEKGWLVTVKMDVSALDGLMESEDYQEFLETK